jgi:hypothetical protein
MKNLHIYVFGYSRILSLGISPPELTLQDELDDYFIWTDCFGSDHLFGNPESERQKGV